MQPATDWLDTGASVKKPRKKRETKVEAAHTLTFEGRRAPSMSAKLAGTNRIWACDGEYVWFRPTRMIGGVKTVVANPTAYERHNRYIAEGQYTYLETQDDVEVYKVNESSPFARKGLYLGELKDSDVRRQAVLAAVRRDWTAYVDCLEELAGRLKGRFDSGHAKLVFDEQLSHIANMIALRGGPTQGECSAGLANIRQKRGVGSGKLILIPNGKAT